MNIGDKIRKIRTSHNLTQEQLATLSGLSLPSIRKYETGIRNPKPEQIQKIAEALGISVYDLLEIDICTVSDLLSLLFKINDKTDMTISADKDDNGEYMADTIRISFQNQAINEKLCSFLAAKYQEEELEQSRDAISEEEYLSRKKIISQMIEDHTHALLMDATPLSDANGSISAPATTPELTTLEAQFLSLLHDCTDEETKLLIKNAQLLKDFLKNIPCS